MLQILNTLIRGAAASAEAEVRDRHALAILDQQMRDAAAAVGAARRALAVALAQDAAEARRLEGVAARLTDLEARAVAALQGGREDLAGEAAEAIAGLEAERDAGARARAAFAAEIARIRRRVVEGQTRLTALERGRRVARAREAARRLGAAAPALSDQGALAQAEATLERLEGRQAEAEAADAALAELDAETRAGDLAERMAAQGFGPALRPTAADVLARLKARAAGPSAA